MPEKGEELYKILKADPNYEGVGSDYNKFKTFFSDEKNYTNLYNTLKADPNYEGIGKDANSFSEYFELKKKEPTIPPLGQAFKLGGESTPQLPLTSQSRLGEKFDYSKNVDRANAISTDIGKINTDLAKHKKTIDFYQKDYLKNQGYNDLSTKGQALKAELDKFDIGGFNKNLEKTKNDLVAMENKVKDYDRLVNEKNQLPESVFENYQKDLALYKNKVNDYNTIVNDPEYQKYFKGSNELHDIYSKQNDIAKNLKTNPEYQEALAKYNEGVIKIKGGINEFNKISTDLKSYHTLKAKENYDKGLAEIKKLNPANKVALYNNTLANINKRFNQNMLLAQQAKEQGDDATLQKLQPILDADVNKMKILEKGSSAQKTIASLQEDNSLGNNLAIGMQMALGGLGTGLKGIDNAITTLQRDAFVAATGYDFTDDTKKKLDEFISKQNTSFPRGLSDEVYKISKPILEKANERSQIQDVSKKYNGSGFEALLNGDFGTAIEYGVKDFSKSLPSSLTYLTPVTAALTSGSMVGQEIDQAKDEKGIATSADVFAGMFKAGLELATERMFGAGRASRELVSRLGKTQAEKAVMDGTKEVIEKTLRQKLGRMYSEEIIGEMTNQIGSNAVDKYIHGKNVSLTDGVGNAGWIALFGAGTQGSLAETATHYIDKKATAKTEELKTQASNLMDEALHQDNPTAAEAIEKHADKLHEEAKVIEDKYQEIIDKATPETLNAIQEVNAKIEDLTASITNVSDEAKPILEQQIVELENEHKKLIKKAEKEVSESLQTTPQEITTEPTSTEGVEASVVGNQFELIANKVFLDTHAIIQPILQRMNNAEYINEKEVERGTNELYDLLDSTEKRKDLSEEDKTKISESIEELINKLENYEFTTTTKTKTVTEKQTVPIPKQTSREVKQTEAPLRKAEGSTAEVEIANGNKVSGTLNIKSGQYVIDNKGNQIVLGEAAITDRDLKLGDRGIELDPETDQVSSITLDINGNQLTITNPEIALDLAIKVRLQEIPFDVDQTLFDETMQEVEVKKEITTEELKPQAKRVEAISVEEQPTQTNITDEKTTNEVREVEDGQREKGNEGGKSKGKNDGQKTNDVQNEEVTEGGVKAPQVTKGSVGVGGDVVGELSPLQKELQKANAPQKLIDAVPKDTKLRESFLTDTKRLVESLLGLAGNFSIKENKVRIGKFYSSLFGGRDKVLIHEAAHAATMSVYGDILRNEGDYTKEQVAAARELNDIAWKYIENTSGLAKMTFPRLYGTTNPYEFIAEFIANPKFRDYVAENSPSKKTNVVNYIWDGILKMLGIKKSEINQELIDKIQAGIDATLEVSAAKNKAVEQSLKETPKAEEVEKTSKQAETSKEDLGYHGGNLMNKSDYLTSGYRGDMPFTGYYFFSDRNRAESRGNRSQLENNDVSVVDFSKYNLLKPTTNEYWSIKAALKKFEDRFLRGNIDDAFDSLESKYGLKDSVPKLFEQIQSNKEKIKKIAEEWKKNELENIDSKGKIERLETLILKQLGYEGVDVRGLKEQNGEASPDSSAEGSVIFDLKPDSIIESPNKIKLSEEKTKTSKPKPENVKAIEEAITKKSGTIKNEIIKEAADPTEVKKILDNLDSIKSKLAGLTTKDGDSVFSEECKWG